MRDEKEKMAYKGAKIAIGAYKAMISPFLIKSCRYYPTCSEYALEAIKKYGILRGLMKGFYRVLRCNPFSSGGYDPA